MVVDGVAYQARRYADIAVAVQGIKDAAGIRSEMKWAKFRGGERTKAYEAIVDLFFSLVEQNHMHFHCIVAEFGKFSHGAFRGGGPDSSVNRMYFQLLVHRVCRYYSSKCNIYVYPDHGSDSKELQEFHGAINLAAYNRYRVPHRLVTIEQTDSSICNVIQMVDVIIGGIAHMRNFLSAPKIGEDSYKAALARYILKKSKVSTWAVDSGPKTRKLTVWNFRHQNLVAKEKAPQSARRYVRQG